MTPEQEAKLLATLSQFKTYLLAYHFNSIQDITNKAYMARFNPILSIIDRNLTSIEKQIKKL